MTYPRKNNLICTLNFAWMAELADATDSKSVEFWLMWVRPPLQVLKMFRNRNKQIFQILNYTANASVIGCFFYFFALHLCFPADLRASSRRCLVKRKSIARLFPFLIRIEAIHLSSNPILLPKAFIAVSDKKWCFYRET